MSILKNTGQFLIHWAANLELQRVFPKALKEAGLDIWEMWIENTREFYKSLAAWTFEAGGASARLWEQYVIWGWNPPKWLDTFFAKLTGSNAAMNRINYHWANKLYDTSKQKQVRTPESVWASHYDIPVLMYQQMLGPTMKYTASEWNPSLWNFDLDISQKLAMEMICQRSELEKSQAWEESLKVLEIWFGYGTLAHHMISNYGVQVEGLTVSDGQMGYANNLLKKNGTLENADFKNLDWKVIWNTPELKELYRWKFNRIVSIEMIEAVSTKDLPDFFAFMYHCLSNDGILFIQAINSDRNFETTEWFIDKYIFWDGVVPQHENLLYCWEMSWFQQISAHKNLATQAYDNALIAWYNNLEAWYTELQEELDYYYSNNHSPAFPYPNAPSFLRIFEYYLKSCAGSFRSGYNRNGQYKFYKSAKNKVHSIVPATSKQSDYIIQSKNWWNT